MSSPAKKQAAAKKAPARRPRAGAEGAVAEAKTVGEATALTAEVTQPGPHLTDAGDGPAAAPGSEVTLPSEQQPLTQPENETGLIDPQAGHAPPEDSNQPSPTETSNPPPPSDSQEQDGEAEEEVAEAEMPLARLPDEAVIAEASSYATAPAEPGDAVAAGYFTPPPPDVRGKARARR
jgi:hypothetical protein